MAKRTDIKKILVIGSGPIVIGQAAEFDYAGTQACLALKEEGYEVILCNSNPATIMTDPAIADKVYMEPLTLEYMAKEPVLPSLVANTAEEALQAAKTIGYPVVLRPAFTLGGTGGGFADDEQEFLGLIHNALALSPVHQVLVEKSIKGLY